MSFAKSSISLGSPPKTPKTFLVIIINAIIDMVSKTATKINKMSFKVLVLDKYLETAASVRRSNITKNSDIGATILADS
ncbi:hypothetical protein SDC9_192656 [bioreactor metagenome]|uniref:Uncharacterized protein n=1 Tax=bioreactor metagenome TaxID=1076179 RepID=A0A645I3Q0_9ZZZZ